MKKYYLIPVIDDNVYLNEQLLKNILKTSYPKLIRREEKRIDILYSISLVIKMPKAVLKRYHNHNAKTKKIFDKLQIPPYLIAYGDDHFAEEILTGSKIFPKYPTTLGVRSVSTLKAKEYYIESNYEIKIRNYFQNLENRKIIFFPDFHKEIECLENETSQDIKRLIKS